MVPPGRPGLGHPAPPFPGQCAAAVSTTPDALPSGISDLRERFGTRFHNLLWSRRPQTRRRWVLRHRSEAAVREISDELAWNVADGLDSIIPTASLAATVRHAVLNDLAEQHSWDDDEGDDRTHFYALATPIAQTLDWLIRHHPDHGQYAIGDIVREAGNRLGIPRDAVASTLHRSLAMDGKLDSTALTEYLALALPPREDPLT
ncbi:hypothetical protein [Streptomyces sp. NPDC004726]